MGMIWKGISFFLLVSVLSGCVGQQSLVSQPIRSTFPTPTSLPIRDLSSPVSSPRSPKPTAAPNSFSVLALPSTFKSDEKRPLSSVDTIVIHSVYNPTAKDPFSIESIKKVFDDSQVSSHFVITRDGKIYQLVSEDYMAWHAGESKMPTPDNREKVNAFSIGVELVGNETSGFTDAQYTSLVALITQESKKLPIKYITGHADIAPGRKTDPWKFVWSRLPIGLQLHR